jgi:hypothetical protein
MTASITHYRTQTQCAALVVEELALPGEFWRYFGLHRSEPYAFLLDSARTLPGLGRFSFLGGAPWLVFTVNHAIRTPARGAWSDAAPTYSRRWSNC